MFLWRISFRDLYDTLLPLFIGRQLNARLLEAPSQPLHDSHNNANPSIFYTILHDTYIDERVDIEEAKTKPKWLVQTLLDSKLNASLSYRTCSSSHSGMHQTAMIWLISSLCDENKLVSLMKHKIQKMGWLPCNKNMMLLRRLIHSFYVTCLLAKKAIGTKWVYKLKHKIDGTIDRYKAKLVTKSYTQEKNIDSMKPLAPRAV
jgi:hypothetical protein